MTRFAATAFAVKAAVEKSAPAQYTEDAVIGCSAAQGGMATHPSPEDCWEGDQRFVGEVVPTETGLSVVDLCGTTKPRSCVLKSDEKGNRSQRLRAVLWGT